MHMGEHTSAADRRTHPVSRGLPLDMSNIVKLLMTKLALPDAMRRQLAQVY
jgi:hypothetical protein